MTACPKPSTTQRKQEEHQAKVELQARERGAKTAVRRRDRRCRFPFCGCQRLGLRLEVAHADHKGMGGNPEGDRSTPDRMILLCTHRHQDGAVSLHKGTLWAKPLTPAGYDGPVAWYVDADTLFAGMYRYVAKAARWAEVGRERAVGVLEEGLLTPQQRRILEKLGEMEH
jgi:hypothetical protein